MNAGSIIAGLMLAASATVFAQSPGAASGGREMRPCSQEPDPAKCEARRKELRERMGQAQQACKGKKGKATEEGKAERSEKGSEPKGEQAKG